MKGTVRQKTVNSEQGPRLIVLPRVCAGEKKPCRGVSAVDRTEEASVDISPQRGCAPPEVEVAFYRKYTEAMLRRYAMMSMESGRVPSMLGREMFRGKVTNYRVQGFDDVVIFCHDVESCLKRLPVEDRHLLKRVAVQQYTHGEAALMLGMNLRTCIRRYNDALDALTQIFLDVRLLEPLKILSRGQNSSTPAKPLRGNEI
jgi:hypothetical protein